MKDLNQLLNLGQCETALQMLHARIDAAPHDGELRLLKGVALFQRGDLAESEQAFREALGLGLHTVTQAWKNLASICYRDRRYAEAADFIASYRERKPYEWDALSVHVSSLVECSRFTEAERQLGDYLEVIPDDRNALATFLFCLGLQGRFLELLAYAGRISVSDWCDFGIVRSISGALAALGLRQTAGNVVAAAVAVQDESGGSREERARMSRYLGAERALEEHRFDDAIELYQSSIHGGEDANVGLFNLSIACLAAGRLGDGWRLMRTRAALFPMATVRGVVVWSGEELSGKRVLVHSEQGIGDVIQFVRYLPLLAKANVQVVFNAYPEIMHLLGNDPRAEKAAADSTDLTHLNFDFQAQLLDLPAMLGTESVTDIPAEVPYLYADSDHLAYWTKRLDALKGLKVGLVWSGNPGHKQDHHRSASLADFSSLAVFPGVVWVLLQKGSGESEGLSPPEGMQVVRLSDDIASFDDTAAIVDCLDLLISVDTSVAHLAGAMGKPVWILLSEAGKDWRWFLERESSPWYPSARLFTRTRETVWSVFFRDVLRPAFSQWFFGRCPRSDAWRDVRSALSYALGSVDDGDDPAVWTNGFRELGLSALPVARSLALDHNDPRMLESLCSSQPKDGGSHSAKAEWELKQGHTDAALTLWNALFERGGEIPPSGFIAWGGGLHDQARYDEARGVWEKALSVYPCNADIHYMAGRTDQFSGLREAAKPRYEKALSLRPRLAKAHNNMGVLYEVDAPLLALASFQRAILLDSGFDNPWRNAARVLLRQNAGRVAAAFMRERCAADETEGSRTSLARALLESGEVGEAMSLLRQLEGDSRLRDEDALIDMAFIYREAGNLRKCRETLEMLLNAYPSSRPGQMFYGWQLLTEGSYKDGWSHYVAGCDAKPTVIPEWRGEPLDGKTLLVFQDQGMGDLFQFLHLIRNIPDGADVTLAVCDPAFSLVKFQGFPTKTVTVSEVDWQTRGFDFQIAQMKLPNLLGIDLAHPPCSPPYLRGPAASLPEWERVCADDTRLKVGIVWAGNRKYLNDFNRSTLLRDWLPLFELQEISLYSLQKDLPSNQARAWANLEIRNIAADCDDWLKTANALNLLDLVISVDTGVAHLAACLGRPTWILLPQRGTDFRWGLEREDVPWYPQARLFRQAKEEPWSAVLLRVRNALIGALPALRAHA